MYLLAKYNTQTDIYFPMVKRGVVDLAVTADWTPATGDTKVSKDGGAVANSTNNPAIASGTSWKLTLTATELSCKWLTVQIVDAATKAVEDQFVTVLTYGNASAFFIAPDYQDAAAFGLSRLDATVTSRMATFTLPTNFSTLSIDASGRIDLGKWIGVAPAALSATNAYVQVMLRRWLTDDAAGTPNALASGRVDAIANAIASGIIAAASFAANALGAVWDEARASHTTAGSFGQGVASVQGNVTGSVASLTTNNDKTGYALSAAGVQAIWDALTSALTTVGSIGKRIADNLDATVSSRLATSGYTAPPTAAAVSTQVWTEPIPGAFAAGSAGAKLNSASAAGDPWGTAVPGAYASGTAGNILGNRLDVAVSTRATSAGAGGAGALTFTYTVYKPDGITPLQDCEVWVSTDVAGANVVAGTLNTNALGQVVFKLDAGTYYFWRHHSAYRFVDPDQEIVS